MGGTEWEKKGKKRLRVFIEELLLPEVGVGAEGLKEKKREICVQSSRGTLMGERGRARTAFHGRS